MDMAVPIWIIHQCPLKTGADLAAIHPDLSQLLQRRALACGQKLSKEPEETTLCPFKSAKCKARRSAKGELGFIST